MPVIGAIAMVVGEDTAAGKMVDVVAVGGGGPGGELEGNVGGRVSPNTHKQRPKPGWSRDSSSHFCARLLSPGKTQQTEAGPL